MLYFVFGNLNLAFQIGATWKFDSEFVDTENESCWQVVENLKH